MFWEYAHLLFERQNDWATGDTEAVLLELAEELGMNTEILAICMADEVIAAAVADDVAEGVPFVRGTPAFIVLRGEEGSIIPGALPAESFAEILDEILAEAE